MSLHDFIREMPKVELHVHLEGSIRPATLLTLAQRNGVALPAQDVDGLREFYRFTDFDHFIQVYFTISGCLRTVDDFSLDRLRVRGGHGPAEHPLRRGDLYAPYQRGPHRSALRRDPGRAERGAARARADFGVEFRWVLDIVRDNPDSRYQVAEWAISAMDRGVVGFGLGGTEKGNPPERFVDAYAMARKAGLHSVPHAGEVAGPDSVWIALRGLKAERIGHGVRSIEDPALVDYLRERQIPLEVCPTSNLCLGIYPSYEAHPVRELWDEGLYITVNSDDPPMFNTDLVGEYEALAEHLGFTAEELEVLSLNALRASFLPAEEKASLEKEFLTEFARLWAWQ